MTTAIAVLDHGLLSIYRHTRLNARRLTHLMLALVPLLALLVGSCKTPEPPQTADISPSAQFREALFPDRATNRGARYTPAAGYISQARSFVANQPQTLMMLTQQEIRYLFGKPSLHRQDANAEVWQYKANGCVVDFYFYNEKEIDGATPTAYIDFRMKDELVPGSAARQTPASRREKSDCLHSVMSRGAFSVPA